MKIRLAMMVAMLLAAPAIAQKNQAHEDSLQPESAAIVAAPTLDVARFTMMDYPQASLRAKEQGEVGLSMCVGADGGLSNVKIVRSSGYPRLDHAALVGIAKVRFIPAKDANGEPVAVCEPPHLMTWVWSLPGY